MRASGPGKNSVDDPARVRTVKLLNILEVSPDTLSSRLEHSRQRYRDICGGSTLIDKDGSMCMDDGLSIGNLVSCRHWAASLQE